MTDLLRIPKAYIIDVTTDGRGNLAIELTEEGERKLFEEARLRMYRLESLTEKRREALKAMSMEDFTEVALSRSGGPDQLERDEIARRLQEFSRAMNPMLTTMRCAMQSAGLLPQEP